MALEDKAFDTLTAEELSQILELVAKRMIMLRKEDKKAGFWFSTLFRIAKWIRADLTPNVEERKLLIEYLAKKNGRAKLAAYKSMRDRAGVGLTTCRDIFDKWVNEEAKNHIFDVYEEEYGIVIKSRVYALNKLAAIQSVAKEIGRPASCFDAVPNTEG